MRLPFLLLLLLISGTSLNAFTGSLPSVFRGRSLGYGHSNKNCKSYKGYSAEKSNSADQRQSEGLASTYEDDAVELDYSGSDPPPQRHCLPHPGQTPAIARAPIPLTPAPTPVSAPPQLPYKPPRNVR
ncbi:hypothetical protein O6H91_03G075100 [Diphasiastrum complanatum]|uniref:Uncharacterized protein n=1 Tax=Diphasiastrum complanatum TaxID=34168 RepID=A0ACC2E7Z1_DIPCM|nr:hypothetical protein O6H91_03G075100 [Diphasiastrum complanatum]